MDKPCTLNVHTACNVNNVGGKKGCTLNSTLLTVERDTNSLPRCWWWKGITLNSTLLTVDRDTTSLNLTAGGGKGYTLNSTLLNVERDKTSLIHTAGGEKGYTLMFTLLTEERDTLSCPPLLVVGRDTLHPHPHANTDDTPSCLQ
jgi:hypothetical protein